ncbi:MAG: sigma-70 family RNA polymerase sigma factor, partial [Candidatus Eisenbacteria bacterium]|nr:sigma-70 family RNA polymerase sigma factor [Candidatus Eisenbacteria bacterium]
KIPLKPNDHKPQTAPDPSDRRLVDALRNGDEDALAQLYDRYGGLLYSVILKVVRTASDAEDVLQETWVQAWHRRDDFDPSRGTFVCWLLSIARSRAIDRLRRRATRDRATERVEHENPEPSPVDDQPARAVELADLRARVTRALEELDPRQRQALELAYWGGLSHSMISRELGEPLGTVKSWLRTGLLQLRRQLPAEEWT